jgi:hypothetical protein
MIKSTFFVLTLIIVLFVFPNFASAQEMEFNFGLAYDRPIDQPLPELSGGFGFNFSACLWVHNRVGLSLGAIGTRHDFNAGTVNNKEFTFNADRDMIFFEGRFRFLRTKRWELIGLAGYTFSNEIHGGDINGAYVDYQDSLQYDSENIGYKGSGMTAGLTVHRAIKSFHQGYLVFATVRYLFTKYHSNQYYDIVIGEGSQHDLLVYKEKDVSLNAKSLSIHLGIVLRFDFANF